MFDPLVLLAARLSDLRQLDGRQIAHVREGIDLHGTRLDDDLLGVLHDFGVAVSTGR